MNLYDRVKDNAYIAVLYTTRDLQRMSYVVKLFCRKRWVGLPRAN